MESNGHLTLISYHDGEKPQQHINGSNLGAHMKRIKETTAGNESDKLVRIHKKHVVNLSWIKDYKPNSGGRGGVVVMADDVKLEVSFRLKKEFEKAWKVYNTVSVSYRIA